MEKAWELAALGFVMETDETFEALTKDLEKVASETIGSISERFDFSLNSIGLLDSLVESLSFENDTQKRNISDQVGAYIGEVVRKNGLGIWVLSESEPDYPAVGPAIIKTSTSIFDPFYWVMERIRNGSEDNLLLKFNFMVSNEPYKTIKPPPKNKGFWGRLFELP